jgi:HK97 gp10 family phage protein
MVYSGDGRVSGYVVNDFDQLAKRLSKVAADAGELAFGIAEGLGDVWVKESQRTVPVDTGQLRARTALQSVTSAGVRAEATIIAETGYAGYVEYGTRYQRPQPYFRQGRDRAAAEADRLGGKIESELRRVLDTGAAWNPRAMF